MVKLKTENRKKKLSRAYFQSEVTFRIGVEYVTAVTLVTVIDSVTGVGSRRIQNTPICETNPTKI